MKEILLRDGTMLSRSRNESTWSMQSPPESTLPDLANPDHISDVTDFIDLLRVCTGQPVEKFLFRL